MPHTPGPWNYGEDRSGRKRVFAGSHEIVRALSRHSGRTIPAAERAANARLLAAAPDLLAACKQYLEARNSNSALAIPNAVRSLAAAVAKAEA